MADRSERILVAVSGGKDSLSLWDVLHYLGYQADGLYIDLGINGNDRYSECSKEFARNFALQHGLTLHIFSVQNEFGATIPEMVKTSNRGGQRACSVCGLIKRRVFNSYARDHQYAAIATGHNLDDEVAVLFSNNLNWNIEQLSRQAPVLEQSEFFCKKIKPFFHFYERETAAYTLMRGIEYMESECPYAVGSNTNYYKTIFNQLERDRPGSKLLYCTRFIQEKRNTGWLNMFSHDNPIHLCPTCGELTGSIGECALCREIKNRKPVCDSGQDS